ncbi:hypothetical protein [Solidesulfovibrio magneticus]|nr:hypothetical protein [Solidesulfovibrio magneticus]
MPSNNPTQRGPRLLLAGGLLVLLVLFALWRRDQALRAVPLPIELTANVALAPGVTLCGFGDLEGLGDPRPYRWGMGPMSQIGFIAPFAGQGVVVLAVSSPCVPDQALAVLANGKTVGTLSGPQALPPGETPGQEMRLRFPIRRGYNTVALRYTDWNHGHQVCSAGDSRRFAVRFSRLAILGAP